MHSVLDNPHSCCGCAACVSSCNKAAISLMNDREGFWYPQIDTSLCINCGLCKHICPVNNDYESRLPISDTAAYSKNDQIRVSSSSGGVFSILASDIIHNGGVVFGAAFDPDLSVHHICVNNENELIKLKGSKYLQSRIENNYILCKKYLEKGTKVLFSGTPCQIRGLKNYLQRQYENLITIDFICHGVPSPLVWKCYLSYKQQKSIQKITNVSFRNKNNGWKNFGLSIYAGDCEIQSLSHDTDPYMRLFLSDVILRPSCYSCHFKEGKSGSDITLADFWGIEHILPDFYNDKGISLVMANTTKGVSIMDNVKDQLQTVPVQHNDAVKYNKSWSHPVLPNPKRNLFFKYFKHWKDYEKRTDRLLNNNTLYLKAKRKIVSFTDMLFHR